MVETRPVFGFRPAEVSGMANLAVLETHASEAGFIWTQRDRAVRASHFRLEHLGRLDARLEGHLQGLRLGGDAAARLTAVQLAECDAGAVFANTWLTFGGNDFQHIGGVLSLACSSPEFARAAAAAIAWLGEEVSGQVIALLQRVDHPIHGYLLLAAQAGKRHDVDTAIKRCLETPNSVAREHALRLVGELRRRDFLQALHAAIADPEPGCRTSAAQSLLLLGEPTGADTLGDAILAGQATTRRTIEILARCAPREWVRDLVRVLAGSSGTRRLAILGAGALGDPAAVPWLLGLMSESELARVCGEALSMMTGIDLALMDLDRDPDASEDDPGESGHPDDADLPWPDAGAIEQWWSVHRASMPAGDRHLLGLRMTSETAVLALKQGYQRQRFAASIELSTLHPDKAVFPVAARARLQQRGLAR